MSAPDRRAKLDRDHPVLSVRRQCAMLGIARSGVYRLPRPANHDEPTLLRRIDEMFMRWPFLGSRRMTAMLRAEGQAINRKHVQRVARQSKLVARGDQGNTALTSSCNFWSHLSSSILFERMPVKPGLSGHRLQRLRA
jgi:putative transposase